MVSCDFAILYSAKRHKVKKIKRLAGTQWGNTKKMNLDGLLRFCDLVFCQTAQSKENKKTSRHTMRKYKENEFGVLRFCDLVFCQTAHILKEIKRLAGTQWGNTKKMNLDDFAILFSAKWHKVKKIKRLAGTQWGNTKIMNLDDFAILFSANRHKVKKIKRLAGTQWGNTKKMNLDGLLRFCDLVFCQTAHSKENKKTSRHTMRKYIEIYFTEVRYMWRKSFGMPNGTK